MATIYNFNDISLVISHPAVGQFVASGQGIGTATVSMTTDRTVVDTAADGSVMMSKVAGDAGSITLAIQQTSALHKWLINWFNYINAVTADQWAAASITINSTIMGDQIIMTNVAPQKVADRPYQAQGQNATWTLLAGNVRHAS